MSNKFNDNSQLLSIYQRNENLNKRKFIKTSLSNNNKIINSNPKDINNINHCFSKTTKNSPRIINTSKGNNFRNKSFNLKNYSKLISKTNLKIENSLDLRGEKNNLKKGNLNIKMINKNLEIKKYQYETNNTNNLYQNNLSYIKANKNKLNGLNQQIYDILTNNNIKKNNASNKDNNRNNYISKFFVY